MKDKETNNELLKYAAALDFLAKIKSKEKFPNKNHQHAAIALSKILKYSTKNFLIFDDDLKGDIVNNEDVVIFKNSLVEFISRGGKIKFVISDYETTDDKDFKEFLFLLKSVFKDQVELKKASVEFKEAMLAIFDEKINFAIGDHDKYRLELFGANPTNKKTRIASGSFNDPEKVSKLYKAFFSKYNTCSDYNLNGAK